MRSRIKSIEYFLPAGELTNADLAQQFPDWSAEMIEAKVGIKSRRVAAKDQFASDMMVEAARALFASGTCTPEEIDYVLLCTQSPDYSLPTTACLVQARLGLRQQIGAIDFNLGCSGYVSGLGLAKGLIESRQARNVLLLTGDTYTKYLAPNDRSVRTIFGDAGTATLVAADDALEEDALGPFVHGTDGTGAENLIVRGSGLRGVSEDAVSASCPPSGYLHMNGPEIFDFTLRAVPECVARLLNAGQIQLTDVDLFVFHQANRYMLEHLRKRLRIPPEKFVYAFEDIGNTVSSTIPIALRRSLANGVLKPGMRAMLVGFGVGYSWAAAMVTWSGRSGGDSEK